MFVALKDGLDDRIANRQKVNAVPVRRPQARLVHLKLIRDLFEALAEAGHSLTFLPSRQMTIGWSSHHLAVSVTASFTVPVPLNSFM